MFKRLMLIGLFTMSVVTMSGIAANAGCIPLAGGGQYCASWITGSEICNVQISGLGNCIPDVNCPVVTCSAFGRTPLNNLCNPDTLDPVNCGLTGTAFCINPALQAPKTQGNSFTLDTSIS